jgi:hypothetical protein
MKTIEDLRKFLLGEMKRTPTCIQQAIKRKDYMTALETQLEHETYKFLLDYMDGKCD